MNAARISRDDGWLVFHMSDPETIAPGAKPVDASFSPMLDEDQTRAVLAYLRRTRAGGTPPTVSPMSASVMGTLARGAWPVTPSTATAATPAPT